MLGCWNCFGEGVDIFVWKGGGGGRRVYGKGWDGVKNCDWLFWSEGGGIGCGGIWGVCCGCWGIIGWFCGGKFGGGILRKKFIGGILGGGILKFGSDKFCWVKFFIKLLGLICWGLGFWFCLIVGVL